MNEGIKDRREKGKGWKENWRRNQGGRRELKRKGERREMNDCRRIKEVTG